MPQKHRVRGSISRAVPYCIGYGIIDGLGVWAMSVSIDSKYVSTFRDDMLYYATHGPFIVPPAPHTYGFCIREGIWFLGR